MISFTGIIVPLLVVASLMSGVAATDFRSLFIDTISVPGSMKSRGYTPLVFIRMMNDKLLTIEATAKTRTEAQRLRTEDEKSIISATVDMLSLTPLVRAVQMSSNLIEFRVNGEIVESGDDYLLRLRIDRYGQKVTLIEVTKPQNDVHALADLGAERIMRITDPQVFCAAVMQSEAAQLQPTSDGAFALAKTDACIRETLPTAQDDDRLWLLNLQGVVAFLEDRPLEAGKHFRAAIRLNPDFSPALLNLGILYAHAGRPNKAVGYFEQVFRRRLPSDSPQIYAAAYTEWADTLVDLGRPDEANAMFRQAVEADPQYAEAYLRWARHTKDPAMAARLQALGDAVARRQQGGLYTENLVGRLRTVAMRLRKPGSGSGDDLEGTLGDVGLLAEPGDRDRNIWDYIKNTWRRM